MEYFQFRGQKDLNNLTGKGSLLGQICILYDLLGDGASALGHMAAMLYKGQTCTESSDPVYSSMAFETPVLLGNVAVLEIHADVVNIHILIMTGIDKADLPAVLVIDDRI